MCKVHELVRSADAVLIQEHFADLSTQDRYLRFGYTADHRCMNEYIFKSYKKEDHHWFGIFSTTGLLIATCHVVMDLKTNIAEFGFTVLEDYRGRGYAKDLFRAGLELCTKHKISKVVLFCLAQNAAMKSIAKSFGLTFAHELGEIEAHIDLTY
jgi:RimJ/RimL family protein N-acetyltransferase